MSTNEENTGDEHAPSSGQDEIPAGYYNLRGIEGTAESGTANTGTEQIALEVEIADGDFAGRRAFTYLYFTDSTEVESLKKLRAMGWDGSEALTGIGKNVVRGQVKYETYNGERRMKVEVFGERKGAIANPHDAEQKRGFFARLKEIEKRDTAPKAPGSKPSGGGAGGKGYPADWDQKGPAKKPAGGPPRVDI